MNMATGFDIEEAFANLVNPKSDISRFFTAMMSSGAAGDWSKLGVKDPFLVALLAEKTALAGGGNFTAI